MPDLVVGDPKRKPKQRRWPWLQKYHPKPEARDRAIENCAACETTCCHFCHQALRRCMVTAAMLLSHTLSVRLQGHLADVVAAVVVGEAGQILGAPICLALLIWGEGHLALCAARRGF